MQTFPFKILEFDWWDYLQHKIQFLVQKIGLESKLYSKNTEWQRLYNANNFKMFDLICTRKTVEKQTKYKYDMVFLML